MTPAVKSVIKFAALIAIAVTAIGLAYDPLTSWITGNPTRDHRAARERYNAGVAALIKQDYEAAEKALLDARSEAGVDPELRFRAAYDLGMAFAAHADQVRLGKPGQEADLAKALELAQQAASWFGDADRLRPGDADTRANVAIMRARVQAIADELRKGEGKLEARLDRLITEQRGVLDEARGAWLAIKEAGGSDPLAQQGTLTHLADRERGIVAEAGVVGDLASDEIDAIGKKPEDKRSEEEKVRVVQLKNLDLYLMEGRTRITEARRKLQELAAEAGVDRSEAALVALKRAREQLLDPITVLRQIAQDEVAVLQDTVHSDPGALDLAAGKPDGKPDGKDGKDGNKAGARDDQAGKPPVLPGWLEPVVIADRQSGIRDRLEEVRARLDAAVAAADAPPPPPANAPPNSSVAPPAKDPKQQKLIERVKAALPAVGDAKAAMNQAHDALAAKQIKPAIEHEARALEALGRAIEQFSDLKQLVELAYAEHQQLLRLLSPEAAKQLDAATRSRQTHELLGHNLGRMPRLRELIADELAQLDEQAASGGSAPGSPRDPDPSHQAPSGGSAPGSPRDPEAEKQQDAHKQQLEQAKQQMTRAEELRGQAATALAALDKALAGTGDPMPPAKDADAKLTELRKLLFSVIEHLQELIREQGETRDQTSAASGEDDFTRGPKLPGLVDRQDGHAQMAKAITDALAQQADAAAKQPQQGPRQGPDAKALAGAADEVRQSQGDMADAKATLAKARDAKTASESLEPGVKSQAKALEHLENALKLLQPPPQKNKNDKDQQQEQQQQQQQQQQKQQKQDPQQQQGGAGQRARDEDARRQRERRDRDSQPDPVEKDW